MNYGYLAELITTILEVTPNRGHKLAERLSLESSSTTTVRDPATALRRMSRESLQTLGLTVKQSHKILAALALGRVAYVPEVAAQRGITLVDDPTIAAALLTPVLAYKDREHAAVLVLDVRHQWLATEIVSIGTKTECLFEPEAVFTAALKHGGKKVIIAHNHPSGSLAPSREDLSLTKVMVKAGYIMNIPVLDHFIIGNGDFASIRQESAIWEEIKSERPTA